MGYAHKGMTVMTSRFQVGLLPVTVLGSLLVVLACNTESRAQKKTPEQKAAEQAAKEQVKLNEAELLRDAYILMAAANHDYAGHRAKAMKQVEQAFKLLDNSVLKKGTNQQKAATLQEDVVAFRAKIVAKYNLDIYEGQALSDAQLRMAGDLLVKIQPVLKQNKHTRVLTHVVNAATEITTALQVR
jgi:hypothetical protein